MYKSDLERIKKILDGDAKYSHLYDRIAKDLRDSEEKGVPVAVKIFFEKERGADVGFCVISISPLKMKQWQKVFKEEGWVAPDFIIEISSFELMYLYVKRDNRRKGIGKKLFEKVKSYAQKTGIRNIYAYVSDTTPFALKFYLKEGAEMINNFSEEGNTTAFLTWQNISKH